LSREAAGHEPSFQAPVQEPKREVAAVALAVGKEAIFQDARRRVELVFKLNLAIAIVLAIILLSGIAGAVFSAFFQRAVWATAFGGIAAADMIGVYVFKPLDAINSAMVASQRLDATALRLYEQLRSCDGYENLKDRIECQSVVWDKIQQELSSLAGPKK
jgi:ABC-type multidrug transport system fused ATPase/permease subunit